MKTILESVRLSYLLEREEVGWDANLNWEDVLSLGEQQRLGMVSHLVLIQLYSINKISELDWLIYCCLTLFFPPFSYKARLFFHKPKFGILDECTKYETKPHVLC